MERMVKLNADDVKMAIAEFVVTRQDTNSCVDTGDIRFVTESFTAYTIPIIALVTVTDRADWSEQSTPKPIYPFRSEVYAENNYLSYTSDDRLQRAKEDALQYYSRHGTVYSTDGSFVCYTHQLRED